MMALSSRIRPTTFASPTAARWHSQPNERAMSSTIRDVDMLMTTGPRSCFKRYLTASARVTSSLHARARLVDEREPIGIGIEDEPDRRFGRLAPTARLR